MRGTRLPVGRGIHDQPVHVLDRPAVRHELVGEPVKKLRMRRPRSVAAEVVRCVDESSAKMPLPDAVDHHAGRQGVLRVGKPRGQRVAAVRLGSILRQADGRDHVGEHGGRLGRQFLLPLLGVAAVEQIHGMRLPEPTGEDLRVTLRDGDAALKRGAFLLECRDRRLILLGEAGELVLVLRAEWQPVGRVGHQHPGIIVARAGRHLDPISGRHPVLECACAVAAPCDLMNRDRLLELEHHPGIRPRGSNPAAAVAVVPVVNELQFVHARGDVITRRHRLCTRGGERNIPAYGIEDLELVDAWLVGIRFEDREP